MFGMGFAEILIIAVIAILFLGPDKLPQTMIEVARFFRSAKRTLASAKSSIEEELHVEDIRREVDGYKNDLLDSKAQLEHQVNSVTELDDDFDAVVETADPAKPVKKLRGDQKPDTSSKPEVVTFSKKKKAPESSTADAPKEA